MSQTQTTSRESFHQLGEDRIATQKDAILNLLAAAGPLSDRDIAERTGLSISSVTARRNALTEPDDGRVTEYERKKHPWTNVTVIYWGLSTREIHRRKRAAGREQKETFGVRLP